MSRKKKLRKQVINQVLSKQISVLEAQARWAWIKTGRYQPPRRAGVSRGTVVKSAAPATGWGRYDNLSDPQFREWAREAAQQEMVTKGLLPGPAPGRGKGGAGRTLVWAPGPDGTFGWQPVRVEAPPGPPIVPPGIAGR
jgi:hypothetical protein